MYEFMYGCGIARPQRQKEELAENIFSKIVDILLMIMPSSYIAPFIQKGQEKVGEQG